MLEGKGKSRGWRKEERVDVRDMTPRESGRVEKWKRNEKLNREFKGKGRSRGRR